MRDSDITVEKFDAVEKKKRQKEKPKVERNVAEYIYYNKDVDCRQRGGSEVTLAGPGIMRNLQTWSKNLGVDGRLYVAERIPWVYQRQKRSIAKSKNPKKNKVSLNFGDFFEVADRVVAKTRGQNFILDFDACKTFESLIRDEYLLEKMDLLARSIQQKPEGQLKTTWLTATFSERRMKLKREEVANIIARVWENNKFSVEVKGIYPYKDGCPMFQILLRIRRVPKGDKDVAIAQREGRQPTADGL